MSTPQPEYIIIEEVHLNRWYESLQRGVPGWQYTVHDNVSGVDFPVFVPDVQRTVQNVAQMIHDELEVIRGIKQLGS